MTISDPSGNVAAGCFRPPSGCGSSVGNTFDRNILAGTFTVNIIQANVDITNHKGVWTCTDGVNVTQYEIKDIASYTKPIIQSEVEVPVTGSVVTVLIGCIYPYPNEVKISYVKESSLDIVLKSRSDVKFDNGSSVNCEHSDARAISMNGSFLVSTDNLNGENTRIAVTALLNGVKIGDTGYSNFTIQSEKGLTTPASTDSADMSTTISEATSPPVNTSSSGLSQEIVITIIISSIFAAGGLVLLIVLVVRQCKQKNTGILAKNKEHHFRNKEGKLTKKEYLKSNKSRKSLYSEKRNIKRGSSSLDKKRNAQFENSVPKDRIYRHYPQTIDCWNKCENQHVFKNSYTEGNMMLHRNWPDNCPKPYSRPNGRMPYQSHNSEHPGHSEGMFQYYRADNVYRGQQMNHQMQYVALKDMHINNKPDSKRSSDRRPYERNWDMLY